MRSMDLEVQKMFDRAMGRRKLFESDDTAEDASLAKVLQMQTQILARLADALIPAAPQSDQPDFAAGKAAQEAATAFDGTGNIQPQVMAGTLPTVDPAQAQGVTQEAELTRLLQVQRDERESTPQYDMHIERGPDGSISRVVAVSTKADTGVDRPGLAFRLIRFGDGTLRHVVADRIVIPAKNTFNKPAVLN